MYARARVLVEINRRNLSDTRRGDWAVINRGRARSNSGTRLIYRGSRANLRDRTRREYFIIILLELLVFLVAHTHTFGRGDFIMVKTTVDHVTRDCVYTAT